MVAKKPVGKKHDPPKAGVIPYGFAQHLRDQKLKKKHMKAGAKKAVKTKARKAAAKKRKTPAAKKRKTAKK